MYFIVPWSWDTFYHLILVSLLPKMNTEKGWISCVHWVKIHPWELPATPNPHDWFSEEQWDNSAPYLLCCLECCLTLPHHYHVKMLLEGLSCTDGGVPITPWAINCQQTFYTMQTYVSKAREGQLNHLCEFTASILVFLTAFNLRNSLYMKIKEKTAKCISSLASDRNKTQQQTHGGKEKAFRSTGVLHLAYWNWLRPWQQVTQSCTAVRLQQVCRKCCASVL